MLPVALTAGVSFVVLVNLYPAIGLLGLIGATCFVSYDSKMPFANIGSIHIPDLMLYVLFFVVILKSLSSRNIRLIRTAIDLPLTIFVLIGLISLIVGQMDKKYNFFLAFREFKVFLYYLLPMVVTNLIRDRRDIKILIYGTLSIGIIAGLNVALEAWISPPKAMDDPMEVFYRCQGSSSGWMLVFWTFAAFVSILFARKIRLSHILGAIVPLIAIILSFSRHLWVSAACTVALGSAFNVRVNMGRIFKGVWIIFFIGMVIIGTSLLRIEPVTTYLNLITARAETMVFRERVQNWDIRLVENKYATEKILSKPIFGLGFSEPYRPQIYGPDDHLEWYIHNVYLWILLKVGIAGFIPFLWFSYIFVMRGIIHGNKVQDTVLKAIVIGSVCSYLGAAIANVAAPHFMENWGVAVFGLALGINEAIYIIEGVDLKEKMIK